MDLEKTEARNDCAGGVQQQFNRPIDRQTESLKTHMEAISNISTVALQIVGGNEMEPSSWGYNWTTQFLGDINTGT
jgi:hypothetical protein